MTLLDAVVRFLLSPRVVVLVITVAVSEIGMLVLKLL